MVLLSTDLCGRLKDGVPANTSRGGEGGTKHFSNYCSDIEQGLLTNWDYNLTTVRDRSLHSP